MVAFASFQGMTGRLPTAGALLAGAVAVAIFALMPADSLESMVWSSGIAAVLPAAEPPLGITARAVLALGGGLIAAAIVWSALYLLFGPGGFLARKPVVDGDKPIIGRAPTVRRADAHPDAPPRRPMTAADLGTPLMEVTAPKGPQPIPADLDTPLAAIDPAAIPAAPREPLRPVAALTRPAPVAEVVPQPIVAAPEPAPAPAPAPVGRTAAMPAFAPGERIETFELTPIVRRPAATPTPTPPTSIEALLRRLEEGAQRRVANG